MKNDNWKDVGEKEYGPVLTVKEMTSYLKISKTYAYHLLENDELPFLKFGKTYRILKKDLDAFCQSKRRNACT